MEISGWFEVECGVEQFSLTGRTESELAVKLVAAFGAECQGVDGEVEGPDGFNAAAFWRLVDQASVCKMKHRPCITCKAMFMSQGAHNRMCDPCRCRRNDFEGSL